jgi:hypothetical protein
LAIATPAKPSGATAAKAKIDTDRESVPNLIVHLLAAPPRLPASRQMFVRCNKNLKFILRRLA